MKKFLIGRVLIILLSFMLMGIAVQAEGEKIPILMYHNVTAGDDEGDALNVSAEKLEEQLRYLKYHGYHTIDFKELESFFKGEASLPSNPIIITFDDGYSGNYQNAYPIFKKYGYRATIFMITDYIDQDWYLTLDMMKEMEEGGTFDIQSHSVNHLYELSKTNKEEMVYETRESKTRLEDLLDKEINVFCYPYGRNSKALRDVLKKEGYTFAVTTAYGTAQKDSDYLRLDRLRVFGTDSGKSLKTRIERNTKNYTSSLFEDVDVDHVYLLDLIEALERGWIEVEDGKVYPDKSVSVELFVKTLNDLGNGNVVTDKNPIENINMEEALGIISNNFYIPGLEKGEKSYETAVEMGFLEGIINQDPKKLLTRSEWAALMNNFVNIMDKRKGFFEDMPIGSIGKGDDTGDIYITGNFYTKDQEGPRDVFTLDISRGLMNRITYFNSSEEYQRDVERIYSSPDGRKLLIKVRELQEDGATLLLIDLEKEETQTLVKLKNSAKISSTAWLGEDKVIIQIMDDDHEGVFIYDYRNHLMDELILKDAVIKTYKK